MTLDLPYIASVAVMIGLLSPFIIVGTGVVLGLTLSISKIMLGMVVGMIALFTPDDEEDF